jgi:hypothetical protein
MAADSNFELSAVSTELSAVSTELSAFTAARHFNVAPLLCLKSKVQQHAI